MAIASAELIADLERTMRASPARSGQLSHRVAALLSSLNLFAAQRLTRFGCIGYFALKFHPAGDEPIAEAG